jgi:Dolichyl-phosphate-mannose-protein mannosyltransferase
LPRKLAIFLILIATLLRLPGIFSQLWLDEYFSLLSARAAHSPLDIFTRFHSDNNHWLNTLWMYLVRSHDDPWRFRLLSLAAGIGTVILAWIWARRFGPAHALAAVTLLGFSEFLIEYSSDARGYALLGFFSLGSLLLFEKYIARPTRSNGAALSICCALAILSHITGIMVWLGIAAALLLTGRRKTGAGWIIWPNVLPAAVVATLYFLDIRHWSRAGGPPNTWHTPLEAAGALVGCKPGWIAAAAAGLMLAIYIAQVLQLRRRGNDSWISFAALGLLIPAFLSLVPTSQYIHARYIYVTGLFGFLLLARAIGNWLSAGGACRVAAAIVLVIFAACNLIQLVPFLRHGRGDYRGAVQYLASHTAGPVVTAACPEYPGADGELLKYYWHINGTTRTLRVVDTRDAPQWLVIEKNTRPMIPIDVAGGRRPYVHVADFPSAGVVSGITWSIYESQP